VPAAAIAAAAWSCVEKMLHEAQRTSAPSACSVSMSTAVWMVMCSDPAMRAPFSGLVSEYSSRIAISAGISDSAIAISRRPQPASAASAMAQSASFWSGAFMAAVLPSRSRGPKKQSARTGCDASAVDFAEPDPPGGTQRSSAGGIIRQPGMG